MSTLTKLACRFSWSAGRDYIFITIGTLSQAIATRLFLAPERTPAHLVPRFIVSSRVQKSMSSRV